MVKPKKPPVQAEKCPEGFPESVWNKLLAIELNTQSTAKRLVDVEARVDALETRDKEVDVLSAKLNRLQLSHNRLQHQLQDLQEHSMKCNLVFTFDSDTAIGKETDDEDPEEVVRDFLTTVMKVDGAEDFYIPVSHRLGGRPGQRPIIAKFPNAKELDAILKRGKSLQGTRHGVSRQVPASMTERTKFAMDLYKDKKTDPRNKARLTKGKLFVKGRVQTQFLEPVLPESDLADDDDIEISNSEPVENSGSIFKGYAFTAGSLPSLSAGLDEVLMRPGVSTTSHLIYAYRIKDGKGIQENFKSDDDYGMGLELLKMLRARDDVNTVCVVTRHCELGFKHLGRKRFEILQEVGAEALDQLP